MERQVKGIWIPIEVWEAKEISWNEKILLMEIDSYTSKGKDCFISNEYIQELLSVSERAARQYISNLIRYGYVRVVKFDGRRRYVESTLTSCRAEWQNSAGQRGEDLPHTYNEDTYKSSIDIEDSKRKVFPFKKSLIEIGVPQDVAEEWMRVRKAKRATNSEIAFKAIRREINKSGLTPEQAIRLAVEKSWSGFDASWISKERKVPQKERKESVFEHNMRVYDAVCGTNYHEQLYGKKEVCDEQ